MNKAFITVLYQKSKLALTANQAEFSSNSVEFFEVNTFAIVDLYFMKVLRVEFACTIILRTPMP